MVAYSFKHRFVDPIRVGLGTLTWHGPDVPKPKRQTIRAVGLRRHARPGETLQLYCGMRHPSCFLIGTARCTNIARISIRLARPRRRKDVITVAGIGSHYAVYEDSRSLDIIAARDGFEDFAAMREFWRVEHRGVTDFDGLQISWEPAAQ